MNLVLLMGSPRSGTTWLAKLFDSHPRVLYRHEPDSVFPEDSIPYVPERDEVEDYVERSTKYLSQLANVRAGKSAGSQPQFRKAYRGYIRQLLHAMSIYLVKSLERITGKFGRMARLKIPDLIDGSAESDIVYVMKSVNSLARTYLFSRAVPEAKIIHIIRHPCAFVASELRGQELKLMSVGTFLTTQVKMEQARARGLDLEKLQSMSREQQLASLWMLQNEKVMQEMCGSPTYKMVVYEELCNDPVAVCKKLFGFCELKWDRQTQEFIGESLNSEAENKDYFQVVRNPVEAATKWRHELTQEQIASILEVVQDSLPGKLYQ